jgi:hypothetical protein
MNITDQHLVGILYNYYLDSETNVKYNIRWDVYLTSKGYTREYVTMMYKTGDQRQRILANARDKAERLKESKLWKVLK